MTTTLRRIAWLVLLTIGGLAYTLLFGEVFVRLMHPQALVPRFVTGGPDGIRANIPNARFRHVTPEVEALITYNAQGMRDVRDRSAPRLPGMCRIALLGDSFFVGFESSYEDSFAARLEEALAEAGHRCEVHNFAVSGFGTAESLRALRTRVALHRPDIVLQSWHRTDPADNRRAKLFDWDGRHLRPTGRAYLPGVKLSDTLMRSAVYRWAMEHSHLYNAAREWAGRTGKDLLLALATQARWVAPLAATAEAGDDGDAPMGKPAEADAPDDDPGDVASSRSLDLALLEAMQAEAGQFGAKFLLFEIPDFRTRTDIVSSLRVLHPSVRDRLVVASPLAAMHAGAGPEVKFYQERGQWHWTPLGNRLASRIAAEAMLERGWLQRPTASRR